MENKFEKRLGRFLVFFIVILFVLTISQRFVDEWIISLLWYLSFLGSWALMLVFALEVLLNKDARGFAIFTAIVTSLGFGILSIHGLSALGMFIRFLPSNIRIGSDFFIKNNQIIFYSSLFIIYFMQMINLFIQKSKDKQSQVADSKDLTEEEIRAIRDAKLNEIIKEIDQNKEDNSLSDKDREILNSHILENEDADESEIKIYE